MLKSEKRKANKEEAYSGKRLVTELLHEQQEEFLAANGVLVGLGRDGEWYNEEQQ